MQVFRLPWGIAPPRAALVSVLGHEFRNIFDFGDEFFKATDYIRIATVMYGMVVSVSEVNLSVFCFVVGAFVENIIWMDRICCFVGLPWVV